MVPNVPCRILLGSVATGTCALALQMPIHPELIRSQPVESELPVRVSIDFDAARTALTDEDLRSISVMAKAAKASPLPVAVAAFASSSGGRDQNLRLARKRAAHVREALVTTGVPRVRVLVVAPTFAANGSPRVEVSLVRGVQVFRAQMPPDTDDSLRHEP
jgi:hypothetical protein